MEKSRAKNGTVFSSLKIFFIIFFSGSGVTPKRAGHLEKDSPQTAEDFPLRYMEKSGVKNGTVFFKRKNIFSDEGESVFDRDDEQILSDERDDDAARDELAGEELTRDEDAIRQEEHPIDLDAEEPDERKTLKRILKEQSLIRIENAARTEKEFRDLIERWDRLDGNRERRERYHEILRSGEEFPLEYGASPYATTFPNSLDHVLDKQIRQGDFLDVIFNCPFEIHELVTDSNLSKILAGLSDDQKELLYLCGVRYLSAAKAAEIRGQTDRNIRKVRFTMIKKINRQIVDLLKIDEKREENPLVKPTGHEKYLLKKLDMKRDRKQRKKEIYKKGEKKNHSDRSGSK